MQCAMDVFGKGLLAMICLSYCCHLGEACCRAPSIKDGGPRKTYEAQEGFDYAHVSFSQPRIKTTCSPVDTDQINGPPNGARLPEGSYGVTYRTRYKNHCKTKYFPFTVEVRKCSWPRSYLANGQQRCSSASGPPNIWGATCTHHCNDGYELHGDKETKCAGDRTWTGKPPECERVNCMKPTSLKNGDWSCPYGSRYKDTCEPVCDHGYRINTATSIVCRSDGQWSYALQKCIDAEPPKLTSGCPDDFNICSTPKAAPTNVDWADPPVDDNSGKENIVFSYRPARSSKFPVGTHEVTAWARDATGNEDSCTFSITVQKRTCVQLSAPPHATVLCSHSNVEGSECSYRCNEGYELIGNATLTCTYAGDPTSLPCESSGAWNYHIPFCTTISCGQPKPVNHGTFACESGTSYQDTCTLSCEEGYVLEQQATIECASDGTWSTPGSCRDVARPVFRNGCPVNIQPYAARLGEVTRVNWTDPYVEDNSGDSVKLVSDVISGQTFELGVTVVTYTATDLSGNKASCNFTVTVTTLTCGKPDFEEGVRVSKIMLYDCPDGTVFGGKCDTSCMQGYPSRGETTITCERDDTTFPPTMVWQWPGGDLAKKPACADVICPNLTAPENGALACYTGNHGIDCYMSCHKDWDVPGKVPDNGRFTCTNSRQTWIPPTMVDCIVRYRPNRARVHADIFYFASDCNKSMDDLREAFIQRITTSEFADACTNVPSCVASNVEVTCGKTSGSRRRRRSEDFYVSIEFDIIMEYDEEVPQALEVYTTTKDNIIARLNEEAKEGHFDFEGLTADEYSVAGNLDCECPPGSACSSDITNQRFSCKRCYKGYFMPEGESECYECPLGTYQDQELATNCTSCPLGMSTLSAGSESFDKCKKLCKPGYMSSNGFEPSCVPCATGSFQSLEGQTKCHLCPLGTSTQTNKATSKVQCVSADFHPSNTNFSYSLSSGGDQATLASWVFIPYEVSTLNISVVSSRSGSLKYTELFLQRENSTVMYDSSSVQISLKDQIRPGAWFHLAVSTDNTVASSHIYLNGELLPGFPSGMEQVLEVAGVIQGEVVFSGILAVERALSADEVKTSAQTCAIDADNNQLINATVLPAVTAPSLCDAIDDCVSSPCGGHPCENQLGGYTCHCQHGWTGDQCQTPPDHCLHVHCMNNGTCISSNTNFTCHCSDDYTGRLCQTKIVDGEWGDWTYWSECTQTCGGGQQHRQRLCNNPLPEAGGKGCLGESNQTQLCGMENCPVHGAWGLWEEWSTCSVSCRGGERTRSRLCDNPAPMHDGRPCTGEMGQVESCSTQVCPGDGDWGLWSQWTPCSASCDGGVQSRYRLCDNPPPSHGGDPCVGDGNVTRTCNDHECPECPTFRRPANAFPPRIVSSGPEKECTITCREGYSMATEFTNQYYCGPATNFSWSHLPDTYVYFSDPLCTSKRQVEAGLIEAKLVMEIDCEDEGEARAEEVRQKIQEKVLGVLPCSSRAVPLCHVQTTVTCILPNTTDQHNTTRRRRSAEERRLQVITVVKGDIGENVDLTANTTSDDDYMKLMQIAEDTLHMLTNETAMLFTVIVDGQTIRPDMSTVDFSGGYQCPAGAGETDGFCVDCPPGTYSYNSGCRLCPMGHYQDEIAATACKPCPPGFTWNILGASRPDQCIYPHSTSVPPSDPLAHSKTAISMVGIAVGVPLGVVAVVAVTAAVIWYKAKGLKWKQVGSSMLSINKIHPSTTPRQCY